MNCLKGYEYSRKHGKQGPYLCELYIPAEEAYRQTENTANNPTILGSNKCHGLPGGSDSKASARNAGDLGSIPHEIFQTRALEWGAIAFSVLTV